MGTKDVLELYAFLLKMYIHLFIILNSPSGTVNTYWAFTIYMGTVLRVLFILTHLILIKHLGSRYHYYHHFTDEGTEVPKPEVICSSSHSWQKAELRFEPRSAWLQGQDLFIVFPHLNKYLPYALQYTRHHLQRWIGHDLPWPPRANTGWGHVGWEWRISDTETKEFSVYKQVGEEVDVALWIHSVLRNGDRGLQTEREEGPQL